MLQSMREKMQGIVAGAIVGLIAVTFALWGVEYYLRGNDDTNVVAKVNGEKITEQQVQRIFSRAQQQQLAMQGKDVSFDQKSQAKLKDKVVQQIIRTKILLGLANKLGLYIGKQQVQVGITQLPIFQATNGGFSRGKFQQILSNFFYSEQDFIAELQGSMMLGQLEEGIVGSNFVLPYEKNTAIKLLQQRRDFGYVVIDMDQFANKVVVNDDEVQQYYAQHKNDYVSPEQLSIAYVELNGDVVKKQIERDITEKKLKQFYTEHTDQFGHDKNTAKPLPFAEVKSKVKELYLRQMSQQLLADQNDKLTDLTYTNSDSLEPAAAALGLEVKYSELFSRQSAAGSKNKVDKTKITSNQKILKAAFSESVLRQGYNSNPIELGDNDIVVLRIKQHIPETVLPLSKVREQVVVAVRKNKMRELAQHKAKEIIQAMQSGQSITSLSKKYDFSWRTIDKAARDFTGVDKEIVQAVFALPKSQEAKSSITLVALDSKGYAVVRLNNVYDGVVENKGVDKAQQNIIKYLQSANSQYEYSLLVSDAVQKAKVKMRQIKEENNNV